MACNSSGCTSDCYGLKPENGSKRDESAVDGGGGCRESVCVKCKSSEPVFFGDGGSEDGKFCADCFRNNVFGKFRLAVTCHAMITPSDNVLVAFSGGPCSRVALQFVHEMQNKAQKNYEASRDRSLPVFGVGVAFVDESAAYPDHSSEIDDAIELIRSAVSNLSPPGKHLHVVPIESVIGPDSVEARDRLRKLLDSVSDDTGKEDLLLHLRMLSLQKVASESGYNRLVLGSCTSGIASYVISAAVKGRGYSLSADIQHVDARWKVPAVLPLRDCVAQELTRLCHLDGLKTMKLGQRLPSGINGLVSSFVAVLQEENPSRESTIVRTAGKLTPFYFNKIPEIDDSNVPLATRRRQKRFNLKSNEAMTTESFCSICSAPLNKSDLSNLDDSEGCQDIDVFYAACCSSCRFQILPQGRSSIEQFYSLLPQHLVSQAKHQKSDPTLLREKIKDCLLLDSEEEI